MVCKFFVVSFNLWALDNVPPLRAFLRLLTNDHAQFTQSLMSIRNFHIHHV